MLADVTLQGRYVVLEPLEARHASELWPAADEPELWRHMTFLVHAEKHLQAWIDGRLAAKRAGTALPFVQRDATTGTAFGSTSLYEYDPLHRRVGIGHTWLGRLHRRTPANTEAKLLLLTHAFETLEFRRVHLKTDHENVRSQRAIERIGATREGVLRNHMVRPDGSARHTVLYAIVAEEWPAVKARLEGMLRTA